jgi:hypothetical protein
LKYISRIRPALSKKGAGGVQRLTCRLNRYLSFELHWSDQTLSREYEHGDIKSEWPCLTLMWANAELKKQVENLNKKEIKDRINKV